MRIPVANIYYLLLYAWKQVQRKPTAEVGVVSQKNLPDLLAFVLTQEVSRLTSRGLTQDYRALEEDIPGIRGKLDLAMTSKRNLQISGRAHCQFDERVPDILRNQILKASLRRLLFLHVLDKAIRTHARDLLRTFDGISDIRLRRAHFTGLQDNRLVRDYAFALHLCELLLDCIVLEQDGRGASFRDFSEDEAVMWKVFEHFVFEFYRREAPLFEVSRARIDWDGAEGTAADMLRLPRMLTDVVLESPQRTIILDAKFYPKALREHHGVERLHSGHLYQLFAYLENWKGPAGTSPEGMLLYPVVERPFAFTYRLKGHPIAIRSIDLSKDWREIEQNMLALVA